MSYEQHAFISYAHVDNLATPDDKQGWVTRFQQQLAAYLSTEIATEAKLWRDDRLRGNEIFSNEIVAQFPRTALLIAVVSPRYIESDWCRREVVEFTAAAERAGGVVVDNKPRVVRVLLKPIGAGQSDLWPAALQVGDSRGYPFFEEVDGQRTLRLDPALGNGERYRREVMFLAEDLGAVIRSLNQAPPPGPPASAAPVVLTVYLAECAADRREDRERLRAELKAHQVQVLPDQRLPELQADYVAEVERLLARCQLSLHLVGAAYGSVPDGPGLKSGVVLQNECAIRASRSQGLARLIWLAEDTVPEVEPQAQFVAALRTSAELQAGADLVSGSLEAFKTSMHVALDGALKRLLPAPETTGEDPPLAPPVFLLCDEKDRKASVPLRKLLREHGYDAALPVFEGDAAAVREANQSLGASASVIVVFYGVGGEAWKRSIDNEVKKQLGLLHGRAAPEVWTCLAEPASAHKDDLVDMDEARLVDGRGGFTVQSLQPLLQALAARRLPCTRR